MILVFCDTFDLPALWAAGRLAARGIAVDVVTAQVLESALQWRHTIAADDGHARTGARQHCRNFAADAAPAAGDQRMWRS